MSIKKIALLKLIVVLFVLPCLSTVGFGMQVKAELPKGELKTEESKQQRWLFLGDSITQAGHYVDYIETWFLLNESNPPEIIDLGLSSETVSGLSESDHPFPRPCLHNRLDKVLERVKPDLVIACYGMNCGIYHPFSKDCFKAYQNGINKLITDTKNAGVDIILLTPPPYAGRVKPKAQPSSGKTYGFRTPAADYNVVLQRYADWVLFLDSKDGIRALDIRSGLEDFMDNAYPRDPVHPAPYGHILMAEAFLQELGKDSGSDILKTGIDTRVNVLKWTEIIKLVRQKRNAYDFTLLNDIGHDNPHVNNKSKMTLSGAEEVVRSIDEKIQAILSFNKGAKTSPGFTQPDNLSLSDPALLKFPPEGTDGYPSQDPNLDVLPGFKSPPSGYGQVPFWWWNAGKLDKERLLWQIEELHRQGVSGMQVNYAHDDSKNWVTFESDPPLFSDEWWDIWKFVADECGKRDMGIGLSGYTLDWPTENSFMGKLVYSEEEIQGRPITVGQRFKVKMGERIAEQIAPGYIGVYAYKSINNKIQAGAKDLSEFIEGDKLKWDASEGDFEVLVFRADRKQHTLNPMHPLAGERLISKFFQQFQDHAKGQSPEGLNYFFHDELKFGVKDHIWVEDFAEQFKKMKGYDVFDILPSLFEDIGLMTTKGRLDFMDVRVQLAEERFFKPVFQWHWSRGMVYGCDQSSRGRNPYEYGDYFRSVRWYTAPGHDTPGGHADLIKGKVSSSIAHLYKRPRVWLEGYHSLGWGATPENLMFATRENYLYGCSLLALHGLYYSTEGSHWEWAPPSYHFRMPYWEHMDVFMKYFERLSYLMSQGVHCCDIAVMYPVAPLQAGLDGDNATEVAFETGTQLINSGVDFDFIDFQSIDRAEIVDSKLCVSGEKYSVLVLPAMKAIRWSTLLKAREFYRKGGKVVAVGALPETSDRAGSGDSELDVVVEDIFSVTAKDFEGKAFLTSKNAAAAGNVKDACSEIVRMAGRDVRSDGDVKVHHRKIGYRDVYMVMGSEKGSECFFRAHGAAELWDPWTSQTSELDVISISEEGTTVRMPLEKVEAQIIVFDASKKGKVTPVGPVKEVKMIALEGQWESELKPTMNNKWGDFRLPVTKVNETIGAEGRVFKFSPAEKAGKDCYKPGFDDEGWAEVTHGYGAKFLKLGPLPESINHAELRMRLAGMESVDLDEPIGIGGQSYSWSSYEFSWRFGFKGDPGRQGFHGLKGTFTDDFICLGKQFKRSSHHQQIVYQPEEAGSYYYLWTSVVAPEELKGCIAAGGDLPCNVYLNGKKIDVLDECVELNKGGNGLLLCYDKPGRGHFVIATADSELKSDRTPLSMQWYDRTGVLKYDVEPDKTSPAGWYRFTAPPGLKEMTVTAYGKIKAWADGNSMKVEKVSGSYETGPATVYRVINTMKTPEAAEVAIYVDYGRGYSGGSALPEPIAIKCGKGVIELGDWSEMGVMKNYSGGVLYRKSITLTKEQIENEVVLDLGDVVATAEVHVNGKLAGEKVAPPWKVDISEFVRPGENEVEILVYNTLSNHYLTIPTWYRGPLRSGLIGSVTIEYK